MPILSSHSARTRHPEESVFARWADPNSWPAWDPDVREVTFTGDVRLGAAGRMRPSSGPAAAFTITELVEDRRFTNVSRMPGAALTFDHRVEPADDGSTLSVEIRIDGPLAPLWKLAIGRGFANAARTSIDGLLADLDAA
ncbi:SRPBCC family protein [Leucobacter iarius]|uniref:Polyketide cyclase/dehydrase/lipid transport protein n=1 Tax=Leucobacter iarius TaxID=333963 RepID=A0ABN2LI34_9MICO